MKNKPIIIIIGILFVLCACAGVVGFLNKERANPPAPTPEVSYEYYIDNELVDSMPTNTEDFTYTYDRFECNNGMTIEFDNEAWTYTTSEKVTGTCKLYFVRSTYNVILTVTNGLINDTDTSYTFKVERDTDGSFKITPNEGHEYKEVSCANGKEAVYDVSTNTLSINSISQDTACKIDFDIKNLVVEITVKNGEGSTTLNSKYGESISTVVKPNEGYEKPKIECTNNQEHTFDDNKFSIAKLTDNTKCTITFEKAPTVTYNLRIEGLPEQVTITAGSQDQSVVSGKDGKFSLKVEDGYIIILDCAGVKPSSEQTDPDGTITYTFLGVTRNITCSVTAQEAN